LFLEKSTKTAATTAALFDSNMHQIGWGFAADPAVGAYSSPSDSLAVGYLGGLLLKGVERRK